jgi:NAD(P)-dependent dehydrogenase (short-subunit alcohol dehydrogenase family)
MSEMARYPCLAGQVVFISGGASGIGEALVRAFAAQGAQVAFVDLAEAAGQALQVELNAQVPQTGRCLFQACDVTDTAALRTAIAQAREALGPIAVLINNAANDARHRLEELTPEFFNRTVAVNLQHQVFAAQAVLEDMTQLGGGSIINLGSTSWMIKGAGYPLYASCKAAVRGLTRALARDLGPRRIRVNSLVPGWVMTPRQLAHWVTPQAEREIDAAQCLPGRLQAEDVAQMALFLASSASRMCTAQDFIVDAGWS